jgi:predicted helicase
MGLMEDYKKEPGGKRKLQEKNSKWINDDYVKFIRYGEHLISKNSEGVLAFINPHGYLDNPTFRGMRWKLLDEFDKIYTIDLHGNAKKGALAPDGVNDENVFDIQQGVSINFFIKREDSDELADVYYTELYGSREKKYSKLGGAALGDLSFEKVKTLPPRYYFVPRDYELKSTYDEGFSLKDLFVVEGNGIVTKRDSLCIQRTAEDAFEAAEDILKLEKDNFYEKYDLPSDVRDWKYEWAREDVKKSGPRQTLVEEINYRPFDRRYIYYTGNSRGFVGWPVEKIMENYIDKDNLGLLCPKALEDNKFAHIFVTDVISEAIFLSSKTGSNARNFPLYLYDRDAQVDFKKQGDRTPNLNKEEVERIQAKLGLTFVKEKQENKKLFAPIDLLDYIYAYLHSPNYRERFREFLKTNYPKVPYPADVEKFWSLVDLGRELRMLHLMKHPVLANFDTTFPNSGSNKVLNRLTKTDPGFVAEDSGDTVTSQDSDPEVGKIWINEEQFFGNVRRSQWEFQIGGYQPAQKWLKARRDEVLDFEQIQYYQRILKVLKETDRIMGEIDRARLKSGKSD